MLVSHAKVKYGSGVSFSKLVYEEETNDISSGCFYFMGCEAESQDFLFNMGSSIRRVELLQFR